MTVPVIDGIDHKTFEYRPVYLEGHLYRGIFEWGMLYKENELPRREAKTRSHDSMPYRCDFCFELYYYDAYSYDFSDPMLRHVITLVGHPHTLVACSR